jgi:diguanylate cyclase (GGDEF)-like protein
VTGCAILAAPTALAPERSLTGVAYLCGLAWITVAIFAGARALPREHRLPWHLLGGAAVLWLAGDAVQRAGEALGWHTEGIGVPDVCWLSSYPFEIAAVNALIRAKGLARSVRRDIQLDVLVVAGAVALGAWHLLIAPGLGTDPSISRTVVSVLYPLGDVVIFTLALAVVMVPGSGGPATALLVSCLGLTLPLDFVFQAVPAVLPSCDSRRLDSAFLLVNALLGAAALHPGRIRLTQPAAHGVGRHLQVWRVTVLGLSLVAANLASAFNTTPGWRMLPDVIATVVISVTIVVRFYRAARAQERATDAIRTLADHDQLTGAANRVLLRRRVGDFLTAGPGLMIYIDLDGFKAVNDTHGHHVGDAVLKAATARLSTLVRETDTVARIGGDEFVVLLHGTTGEEARAVGERVVADLCRPVTAGDCTTRVGASVGVVVFASEGGVSAWDAVVGRPEAEEALCEEIMNHADSAMYEAKRRGGGIHIVEYSADVPAMSR